MTDLQNKLIELSKSLVTFKCIPLKDGWSIIVTNKDSEHIGHLYSFEDTLAYDKDQKQILT